MKILVCMCGVTRLDGISNKYIRENLSVTNVAEKIRGNRLVWYGRFEKRNNEENSREDGRSRGKSMWQAKEEVDGSSQGRRRGTCGENKDMVKDWRNGEKEHEKLTSFASDRGKNREKEIKMFF